jgi:hypothetical protein
MRTAFAVPVIALTLFSAALAGCGATGALYPEAIAQTGPVPAGRARVVWLRSDDFANRNVASPIYIRVDEDLIGKLAHTGFLIADVEAGDFVLKASARYRWHGVCELAVTAKAGETLYVDVDPRPENYVAQAAGMIVGGAVVLAAPATVGVGDLMTSTVPVEAAVAGATAEAAASAVEGAGKRCAGPYVLTPLADSAALSELTRLRSSH